jgi:hypothetical protein
VGQANGGADPVTHWLPADMAEQNALHRAPTPCHSNRLIIDNSPGRHSLRVDAGEGQGRTREVTALAKEKHRHGRQHQNHILQTKVLR